jgi:hypothetical protein
MSTNAGDQVVEVAGQGADTIWTSVDYALTNAQSVETLRVSGPAGAHPPGQRSRCVALRRCRYRYPRLVVPGSTGSMGGLDADMLQGGAGNDAYYVDNLGDQVFETLTVDPSDTADAGGIDQVFSTVSFDLFASNGARFIEKLTPVRR